MNEKFYEKYDSEEQEVIVLIQKIWGISSCDGKRNMLATTLGIFFCADGTVNIKKGRLNWLVPEEALSSKKAWNKFQKEQICRLKVRKLLDEYVPKKFSPEEYNAWYLVDVLEQKAVCPQLEKVLEEYNKPVIVKDEILGTLTLNREFDMFEGSIELNNTEVSLTFKVDAYNPSSWENIFNFAKNMITEFEKWDKTMRIFSAKELTDLANEWLEEDTENSIPITEEIFAERIFLSMIYFSFDNSFTVYYEDDDMFSGHSIEVFGSLEQGIEFVSIVG